MDLIKRHLLAVLAATVAALFLSGCSQESGGNDRAAPNQKTESFRSNDNDVRPNVLLIVADDLGYTDLGVFGSEIATPNIDSLANAGVVFTNFYTAAACSPTRAMLLSGVDHHLSGLGTLDEVAAMVNPELRSHPGYEGHLNDSVVSVARLLHDTGYRTLMTGKWHLGGEEDTLPNARGFERSFVLTEGGSGHFTDIGILPSAPVATYFEDGMRTSLSDDFYSTKSFVRKLISFLDEEPVGERPFFAFLSFTAPHWPLQAPKSSVKKYAGFYDEGYEALFEKRLSRQIELGFVGPDAKGHPPGDPPWNRLTAAEKKRATRVMEIYAAMIDDMDFYIGQLVSYLKDTNQFENTVIIFMSDNGAEALDVETSVFPPTRDWITECCDNRTENLGEPNSFVSLGPNWARASVGAGRLAKGFAAEGGIHSPAFISYSRSGHIGDKYDGFISVLDVMPTILDFAETEHPVSEYNGRQIYPLQGTSFRSVLGNVDVSVHDSDHVAGWEFNGSRALRRGDWKLMAIGSRLEAGPWQLFNIAEDPSESSDLSDVHPEIYAELLELWNTYAEHNGVLRDIRKSEKH